jgi:hypothetical protein
MNFIAPFSSSAYLVFRNLKDVKNPNYVIIFSLPPFFASNINTGDEMKA